MRRECADGRQWRRVLFFSFSFCVFSFFMFPRSRKHRCNLAHSREHFGLSVFNNTEIDRPFLTNSFFKSLCASNFVILQPGAKAQLLASLEWRKANNVDDLPVPGPNNSNGVMYGVRGWHSVPDANIEASQPNVPEHAVRLQNYMGGSCLHKWDKAGRPIYIERMVRIALSCLCVHTKKGDKGRIVARWQD